MSSKKTHFITEGWFHLFPTWPTYPQSSWEGRIKCDTAFWHNQVKGKIQFFSGSKLSCEEFYLFVIMRMRSLFCGDLMYYISVSELKCLDFTTKKTLSFSDGIYYSFTFSSILCYEKTPLKHCLLTVIYTYTYFSVDLLFILCVNRHGMQGFIMKCGMQLDYRIHSGVGFIILLLFFSPCLHYQKHVCSRWGLDS